MLSELAKSSIGVLGYGREGRAFVDVLLRRHPDAQVVIFDEKRIHGAAPGIRAEIGAFDPDRLREFDVLVRSPGVPGHQPALAGLNLINPSSIWFAERPNAKVVAVTGSKGKSTTASLLAHLARACGLNTVLAGNIGEPLIGHIETQADLFVVELSSYQLSDLAGQPALGVITRLFPEHLDWHGGEQAYVAAKLRLIDLLAGNQVIVNASDPVLLAATAQAHHRSLANRPDGLHGRAIGLFDGDQCLLPARKLPLIGAHNAGNIALALCAGERLGLGRETMLAALADFRPLPHRLEPLTDGQDRRWINDSIATSPHATRAALEALEGQNIILLAGGLERGADWSVVFKWCEQHPLGALITLPDNGTRIAAAASDWKTRVAHQIHEADDLEHAVTLARGMADENTVVLMSPGAPSFPRFRDFEERGEVFRERVKG